MPKDTSASGDDNRPSVADASLHGSTLTHDELAPRILTDETRNNGLGFDEVPFGRA